MPGSGDGSGEMSESGDGGRGMSERALKEIAPNDLGVLIGESPTRSRSTCAKSCCSCRLRLSKIGFFQRSVGSMRSMIGGDSDVGLMPKHDIHLPKYGAALRMQSGLCEP